MRVTIKLAYSQIKINRLRTIWTLIGIILSTALITAVCSFAASCNDLLVNFYGDSYGATVEDLSSLLLIPVTILCAIIALMAIVVISNAFRVSASERRSQFGILKSVGTTKQQITSVVINEGLFLSAMGIPIGVIAGLILTFVSVQVANHYLGELNGLIHLMINKVTLVLNFVISWQAILAAVLVSFFAVLISAWLPAHKAAKLSAIDSIRGAGEVKLESKQIRTSRLSERFFSIEGTLAAKSMKRSKRNLRASVISLSVGIVLFICLSSLSGQINSIVEMMFAYSNADVIVDYSSALEDVVNEVTGKKEAIIIAPIDSKKAEVVTEKLQQYEDVTIFGVGGDLETYTANIPSEMLTPEMMSAVSYEELSTYEIPVEIITLNSDNYASICDQADVPVGSNILINNYIHNNNGNAVTIEPFLFEGQSIQLTKADGSTSEMEIQGELKPEDVPDELIVPNTQIVRIIVPQGIMRGYSWYVNTADSEGFIAYGNTIMNKTFPNEKSDTYMEAGFSARVYKMQDFIKVINIAVILVLVLVYCFVILLALIGLTNVISTLSTNVQIRSREFAVLKSVGITPKGLKRMLNLESAMCSARALIIGLPLAIVLTYIINIPIRSIYPVPYQFPWLASLCCIAAVFAITWGTMRYSSSRLQNKNIVETIRLGT